IGASVSPLAQHRLDEAFGLAVRLRPVRPGEDVREAELPADFGEGLGTIAGAVVGHDACDVHAEAAVVSDGLLEEGDGALLFLITPDLGEGQARCVVDRNVDELVAGAAAFALLTIMCDAVAGSDEPAELLDVDMDELAGQFALIAAFRFARLQ